MKTVRPVNKNLLPQSFWHGTQPMKLQVLHDTGNYLKGDTANANRNYWFNQNNGVSAHSIIDKTQILETLPKDQKGWHVGGAGNTNSWGVELCNMTTQADFNSQIDDCARYFAQVRFDCMGGIDVTKDNLKSHHECNLTMATGSDHVDPTNYLKHYGWTMDMFRAKVQQYLNELKKPVAPPVVAPTPAPTGQYGVVTADVLNVRSGRGTNYPVIGTLAKGTKVKIDTLMGDWYSIYYGDHGGFVSAQYLQRV